MTETNFTIQWLKERFVFDSFARNKQVEKTCLDYFQDKNNMSILDIGSGTGASCIYFMEKISANQIWTMVELNQDLAAASLERIANFATQNAYIVQSTDRQIFMQKGRKFITVKVLQESFLELEHFIDLGGIDWVTATAVFDLLTRDMFRKFIATLMGRKIPVLATINYEGMSIFPASDQNKHYTDLYSKHMQRLQDFGRTMGGDVTQNAIQFFQEKNSIYTLGESNWKISSKDTKMIQYLLNYMQAAISELLSTNDEKQAFKIWLAEKYQQKNLSMEVRHWDFFLYF